MHGARIKPIPNHFRFTMANVGLNSQNHKTNRSAHSLLLLLPLIDTCVNIFRHTSSSFHIHRSLPNNVHWDHLCHAHTFNTHSSFIARLKKNGNALINWYLEQCCAMRARTAISYDDSISNAFCKSYHVESRSYRSSDQPSIYFLSETTEIFINFLF